jgi:transposase-like protein
MAKAVPSAEVERRERVVASWRASGASAPEFARRHGVSRWALYRWASRVEKGVRHQRRGRSNVERVVAQQGGAPSLDLMPVQLLDRPADQVAPAADARVEIQLRTGEVVRVIGEVPAERVRAVVAAVLATC